MDDDDVLEVLDHRRVIELIRSVLGDSAAGRRLTPPRAVVELEEHRLVFTAGGDPDAIGFRAYGRPGMQEEIIGVWDRVSGELSVVVVGRVLGPVRTGSIGAVAVDAMARPDARSLTIIGSGKQARSQLRAISHVRDLAEVVVTSPTAANRESFAAWAGEELEIEVRPTADTQGAVVSADIVVCATTAAGPVLDASWVTPGTHVSTLGQRDRGASEIPLELGDVAAHIATDAPAQLAAFAEGHVLHGTRAWDRVIDLGTVAEGGLTAREPEDITLFLSVGLSGTEVALAQWVAAQDR
jgi:alanine dehydrogenase